MNVLWLVLPGAVAGLAAASFAIVTATKRRGLMGASVLGAISALFLVTGWLLADPGASKADALKTGGLAGGAILALYGLWINDRRRRTEEARQDVESTRVRQDRERVSDERFAKAIELLGHEADQVRVGALHALAGLAQSRPSYTQTVLDVLCSYLRRPFMHPSYAELPADPDQAKFEPDGSLSADEVATADRERQVRVTAHRLIADLLPGLDITEPVWYNLDLTAANLEYLDLTGRQIGQMVARRARLHGISRLSGMRVHGLALFSDAVFSGTVDLFAAEFDGGLSLMGAQFDGSLRVPHTLVRGFVDLRTAPPGEQIGLLTVADETEVKLGEDTGWALQSEQSAGRESIS
jgi:uncharacterized membrane protein YeaQ/YmgE (transglycosylase-associated protein family)